MKNLNRISNYWNRIEALRDWERMATEAKALGLSHRAEELQPKEGASWRAIDKATRCLRAYITGYTNTNQIIINPPPDDNW